MKFLNMLKRDIRLLPDDGRPDIVIPSSGLVHLNDITRLTTVHDDHLGDIPVSEVETQVVGMPDPQDDVSYIVSWKVLNALRAAGYDVSDVYCPDVGIRAGQMIVGSRRLLKYV